MKKAAVIVNAGKDHAINLTLDLIKWALLHNLEIMLEPYVADLLNRSEIAADEAALQTSDFAIVLGGDGTLLRASRIFAPHDIPILAIRFGRFGFLTDIEPADTIKAIEDYTAGNFHIHERMMTRNTVTRGNEVIAAADALNDAVIGKGPLSRMLKLSIFISDKYVATYDADGLIIATPNGSTAYSLSAGGPLVAPDLQVLIITPICPHSLTMRPLIISSQQIVNVKIEGGSVDDIMLTIDGQIGVPLQNDDIVTIEKSSFVTKLISVNRITFYDKLQTRLKWSDRFDTCMDTK
jgi:NAD+ kinase